MQRISEQVQKLVNTERIWKEDPPGNNILSAKASKKMFDAGNCELNGHIMSAMLFVRGLWIRSVSLRRQLHVCRGNVLLLTKKIQATHRRRLHDISEDAWSKAWCFQPWQKHLFQDKQYTSILDYFQNDGNFMEAS